MEAWHFARGYQICPTFLLHLLVAEENVRVKSREHFGSAHAAEEEGFSNVQALGT